MVFRFLISTVALILAWPLIGGGQVQFATVARDVVLARLHDVSPDNAQREATLKRLFTEAGCANLTEEPVKHLRQPNLICLSPGETKETIVVGAHLDKVDVGTGAVDDWSGAALLPSLYEALARTPHKHTYVFVAFTGEEKGLIGSDWYVKHLSPEELKDVTAMVNLECLGMSPTKVWVTHSDKRLVSLLAGTAAALKEPVAEIDVDRVGNDDSDTFRRKKVPNITIHSVTQDTFSVLHSTKDQLDRINPDDYFQTYRLTSAFLAELDTLPASAATASGAR